MNSIAHDISEKKGTIYTDEELASLDDPFIPRHVAIIMDGNRRWAHKRCLPASVGHWRGADTLTKIVRAASELGIKTLTVFAFSTENWKRSSIEVNALMHLIKIYLIKQRPTMIKEGVKLGIIGDISRLPEDVQKELNKTIDLTSDGTKIELVLALNYGGRDEIRRAVMQLMHEAKEGKIDPDCLTEEVIGKHLDSAQWADPSLVIRTSGEHRMSNFLLWQSSYSEVCFSEELWPDFNEKHLLKAVHEYQKRERRIGS